MPTKLWLTLLQLQSCPLALSFASVMHVYHTQMFERHPGCLNHLSIKHTCQNVQGIRCSILWPWDMLEALTFSAGLRSVTGPVSSDDWLSSSS